MNQQLHLKQHCNPQPHSHTSYLQFQKFCLVPRSGNYRLNICSNASTLYGKFKGLLVTFFDFDIVFMVQYHEFVFAKDFVLMLKLAINLLIAISQLCTTAYILDQSCLTVLLIVALGAGTWSSYQRFCFRVDILKQGLFILVDILCSILIKLTHPAFTQFIS